MSASPSVTITVTLAPRQLELERWSLEDQIQNIEHLLAHHEGQDLAGHRELGADLRAVRDHVIEALATHAAGAHRG